MAEFFSSGMVAIMILAFMAIEGLALTLIFRRSEHGIAPLALVFNLGAGFAMMLALLAALVGARWPWMAAALTLSLGAHVMDIRQRWSNGPNAKHAGDP